MSLAYLFELQFWQFVAGLGLFLFALQNIEQALDRLAGPKFRIFLRRNTGNPVKAVFAGAVTTAILQSSTLVSLMMLALLGAEIIGLKSALGIVIGANLGTTVTGWLVALFGFKLDLDALVLPAVAIGCVGMFLFKPEKVTFAWAMLFASFGFLLMGLGFMQASTLEFQATINLDNTAELSLFWFFAIGFVLTAIIQSSSATMVITLSALSAGVIDLYSAAGLVVGADLGTTMTVLIGSIKSRGDKKRLAFGQFIFNLLVDFSALIFLKAAVDSIQNIIGLQDPLYTLVAFHSLINLIGMCIFFPFLGIFESLLLRLFSSDNQQVTRYLSNAVAATPELAIEGLEMELRRLIGWLIHYNQAGLRLNIDDPFMVHMADADTQYDRARFSAKENYQFLKLLEGEIISLALELQRANLQADQIERLNQIQQAARFSIQSAKNINDIKHNLDSYHQHGNLTINDFMTEAGRLESAFYQDLVRLEDPAMEQSVNDQLIQLQQNNDSIHERLNNLVFKLIKEGKISKLDLSTLLNVIRELHSSKKALITALTHTLVDDQLGMANDVPGAKNLNTLNTEQTPQ